MSSVNTNFSNLISYMQEEDSKKSSLSGLVDLKYKEYDDNNSNNTISYSYI